MVGKVLAGPSHLQSKWIKIKYILDIVGLDTFLNGNLTCGGDSEGHISGDMSDMRSSEQW